MTATGHAIIGTVIAAKIGDPVLAVPIAFVSHIAADLVPHWDFGTHKDTKTKWRLTIESTADVLFSYLLSFLLIIFLFPQTNILYGFFIVFIAQLLDWATTFYMFLDLKYPPFSWIYQFSKITNTKLDKPWGIIIPFAIVSGLIVIAKVV